MSRTTAGMKQIWRKLYTSLRRIIPTAERRKADSMIARNLIARSEWQKAEVVCLSMSMPDEMDTHTLIASLLNAKKTVVLPRTEKRGLSLHTISSIHDLTLGPYNILEPKASCKKISASSVDLYIVPGVAFDRNGYRLGWGKGYYDSLLKNISAPKIGLAYAMQLIAELPHTSYDVPVNIVITEDEVINV